MTNGELPLATTAGDTITINGAGARNTAITAGGASRVFDVGGTARRGQHGHTSPA